MSIKYKLAKVALRGKQKGHYYARAVHSGTMKTEEITKTIQENCTLRRSDVLAVLSELADVMNSALRDSRTVYLEGIGYFSVNVSCKCKANPHDITARDLTGHIVFRPAMHKVGKEIKPQPGGEVKARRLISADMTKQLTFKPSTSVKQTLKEYDESQNG